jgi:hypothetical protein
MPSCGAVKDVVRKRCDERVRKWLSCVDGSLRLPEVGEMGKGRRNNRNGMSDLEDPFLQQGRWSEKMGRGLYG